MRWLKRWKRLLGRAPHEMVERQNDDERRLDRRAGEAAGRAGIRPGEAGRPERIPPLGEGSTGGGRGVRWLADAASDARNAGRLIAKSPGYAAATLLTLALGIGATTAVFSVVNTLLLRPLPFSEPERLLMVMSSNSAKGIAAAELTAPDLADFRARTDLFEGIAAIRYSVLAVTDLGEPEMVEGARVSGDFFEVLGVPRAQVGRLIQQADDRAAQGAVVVLTDGYWRRRFGADARVVGKRLTLDGTPHEIIGVLPASFFFPRGNSLSDTPGLWVPLALDAAAAADRGNHVLLGVARARPGVTPAHASRELAAVARRLEAEHPESNAGWSASARPLAEVFVGDAGRGVLVLFAAVALVLLIAVANLATLSLARMLARGREFAVRSALGASAGRLIRQLAAESVVLVGIGGVAGLLIAAWGAQLLRQTDALRLPASTAAALDVRVLGFTFVVTLAVAIFFTIAGAARLLGADAASALRERGGGVAPGHARMRSGLVVAEVALAVILLAGAGLVGRSFLALSRVHPGFDADGAVTFELPALRSKYPDAERRRELFRQAIAAVGAVPGVTAVGAINQPPLGGSNSSASFLIRGAPPPADGVPPTTNWRAVDAGYFRAMRIPILSGRGFAESDGASSPGVVVVSRTAADRFWPGRDPVGQHIVFVGDTVAYQVVGVAGDVKEFGLGIDFRPTMYLPYAQADSRRMTLIVRAAAPGSLVPALRAAIRGLDPDQPITNVSLLRDVVDRSLGVSRVRTALLGSFAGAALILASVGLYGVIAFGVRQRRKEIAMRIALGARPSDVVRLIVRRAMRLVLMGTAAGGIVALLASAALEPLLFGVPARDPRVFGSIVLLISAVALLASWAPARHAARLDPSLVLNQD